MTRLKTHETVRHSESYLFSELLSRFTNTVGNGKDNCGNNKMTGLNPLLGVGPNGSYCFLQGSKQTYLYFVELFSIKDLDWLVQHSFRRFGFINSRLLWSFTVLAKPPSAAIPNY